MDSREHDMQAALVDWIESEWRHLVGCFFHPPNGGQRTKAAGMEMKRIGARRGVPDLFFLRPCVVDRRPYVGCVIEMKDGDRSTTRNQDRWLLTAQGAGWFAVIATSLEGAKRCLMDAYPAHGIRPCLMTATDEERAETYRRLIAVGVAQVEAATYAGKDRRILGRWVEERAHIGQEAYECASAHA